MFKAILPKISAFRIVNGEKLSKFFDRIMKIIVAIYLVFLVIPVIFMLTSLRLWPYISLHIPFLTYLIFFILVFHGIIFVLRRILNENTIRGIDYLWLASAVVGLVFEVYHADIRMLSEAMQTAPSHISQQVESIEADLNLTLKSFCNVKEAKNKYETKYCSWVYSALETRFENFTAKD
jgi:hypothetical protein